ncbi:MAG: DUF4339 domain-containing protein [Bacteroidales bacterium]|nr:DUF4339 domain-containing protein [Bacteroidales bacterium]
MKEYYVSINGVSCGPYTKEEIRSRHLTPDTLVWTVGFEDWMPIDHVRDLYDCVACPTAQPFQPKDSIAECHLPIMHVSGVFPPKLPQYAQTLDNDSPVLGHAPTNSASTNRDKVKITAIIAFSLLGIIITLIVTNQLADSQTRKYLMEQSRRAEQQRKERESVDREQSAERERLEFERRQQAERESRELQQRIFHLQNNRQILLNKIKECGVRLRETNGFHFFRTSAEKKRELDAIIAERNTYLDQLSAIDAELRSLGVKE